MKNVFEKVEVESETPGSLFVFYYVRKFKSPYIK